MLCVALVLRTVQLTSLPAGMHGDEAIMGLDGQRILREGYIGPYTRSAWGQPAGPMYLTALSVKLLGNTLFAVRIVSALMGTLTVLALYLVLRRHFGRRVALLAGFLLATMAWHLHFTRVGLPLASWPLFAVLAAGAVAEAIRRGNARWWAIAGFALASGIYVYNSHPLFLAIVTGFVGLTLLVQAVRGYRGEGRRGLRTPVLAIAAFALAIGVTALPLVLYAADERNGYSSHFDKVSEFKRPEWKRLESRRAKVDFVTGRYQGYWRTMCCRPRPDGTDGIGITPVVPLPMLLLAGVGIIVGLRRREPLAYLGLLVVLLLPLAPVFTHVDGGNRRTLAMAPFVAMFAALPLGLLGDRVLPRRTRRTHGEHGEEGEGLGACSRGGHGDPPLRWLSPSVFSVVLRVLRVQTSTLGHAGRLALLVGVLTVVAILNVRSYFVGFGESGRQRWVYAQEITDASRYMAALPPGRHVYFYSDRWSVNYETRRFLAPNVTAENRSPKFGVSGVEIQRRKGAPVFVFLGKYEPMLEEVRGRYPGGAVTVGPSAEIAWRTTETGPTFVAYALRPEDDVP